MMNSLLGVDDGAQEGGKYDLGGRGLQWGQAIQVIVEAPGLLQEVWAFFRGG